MMARLARGKRTGKQARNKTGNAPLSSQFGLAERSACPRRRDPGPAGYRRRHGSWAERWRSGPRHRRPSPRSRRRTGTAPHDRNPAAPGRTPRAPACPPVMARETSASSPKRVCLPRIGAFIRFSRIVQTTAPNASAPAQLSNPFARAWFAARSQSYSSANNSAPQRPLRRVRTA